MRVSSHWAAEPPQPSKISAQAQRTLTANVRGVLREAMSLGRLLLGFRVDGFGFGS